MGLLGRRTKEIMVGVSEEATKKFPVVIQKFSQEDRFELSLLQAEMKDFFKPVTKKQIKELTEKPDEIKSIDLVELKEDIDYTDFIKKTNAIKKLKFLAGVKTIEGKEIKENTLIEIDSEFTFDFILNAITNFQSEKKVDDVAKN